MRVTVVDEHHHAMYPYWSLKQKKAMTLLHFDSHPDMVPSFAMSKKSVQCLCAHKCTNREKLMEENSIETWIPTLILEGYVHDVIWVCGKWCKQIPEGKYKLLVGTHDNRVKIARNDGKKSSLPYFGDEDQVPAKKLKCAVEWTLHVMKSVKPKLIKKILGKNTFVIDIDEDYFSTNNPFVERVRQYFGNKVGSIVEKVGEWKVHDDYAYYEDLKEIILEKKQNGDKSNLISKGNPYKMVRNLMNESTRKFKQLLIDAIEHTHLPHHITPMHTILEMMETMRNLFQSLPQPAFITIATSREDEYLPELQALDIYEHTIKMLRKTYKSVSVRRLDKVTGYSV